MRKIIYKFIFIFVLVSFGLLMWPQKQVKALEEDFAPTLIKATWVHTYYDVENENTYEFVVEYKIDDIIINALNRFEYFFITERYFTMYHDRLNRNWSSYTIEEIQIKDNSTILYVRLTLDKARINSYYGGVENVDELFSNESAFYVSYDVYGLGYSDGYIDGYNDGTGMPNGSEVKFYNLHWYELPTQVSDTTEYELRVEVGPGIYESIDAVLTYEFEVLKLYGVVVFNYPTSKSVITDEKTIMYKEKYNSEQQVFNNANIDYIAVKKMSNKFELYISNDRTVHSFNYYVGSSRLEGYRIKYTIPDYTYEDGYDDGYHDGYLKGKEDSNDFYYEQGYQEGYIDGHEYGYNSGYNKGISENMETGGFGLMLKQVFTSVGSFLEIELLPGIPFGAIIAVPIVFGIIAFILGRRS